MTFKALTLAALTLVAFSGAARATTPAEIKAAFTAKVTLATRSGLTRKIATPGTVVVLAKSGINADPQNAGFTRPTKIRNGSIEGTGGSSFGLASSGRSLPVGEKLYIFDIDSNAKIVGVEYGTVNTYDRTDHGNTIQQYYKGALYFEYDEGVANIDTAKVLADIGVWLKSESEAASSSTKAIALGQTQAEVVAIMGAPDKKVELGPKTMFYYKDMKVIFQDGKVADVQ